MPELPEVETTVRALRQPLVGRTFIGVRSSWPRQIVQPDLAELQMRIHRLTVQSIWRRAKYLVFTLDGGESLIIHLKMSGHLSVVDQNEALHRHVRTVFSLDNGQELRFRDQRKFGRIYLLNSPDELFGRLGPEPLEESFTPQRLKERLAGRSRALKPLLLDQQFIAGVGNIYANEALYYAGLHPARRADSLSPVEITALHGAIQKALNLGLQNEGASIDQYQKPDGSLGQMQTAFVVHGREDQICHQCGGVVKRQVISGRSTFFCPVCQT